MTNKVDMDKARESFGNFLTALGFDWTSDPNMSDTPKRVSKMYAQEIFENPRQLYFLTQKGTIS